MKNFVDLMEKIENSGAFSVAGKLTSIPPALKVKGLGTVSLPVIDSQAKKLIELSEQAPFGRGEDTVVDTTVRNAWQISAEKFSVTNPQWLEALQKSVDQMGEDLGLHNCKVNFEPYKLLIYEKGSFFTPHRDTEKMPNMFATLVINLPSEYKGGELLVSHKGKSHQYSFADNDGMHPDFATFYADCYHEVRPIDSGYRVCLIYNLAIANRKKQPLLSDQFNISEQVRDSIAEWVQDKPASPALTYLLEYSYSETNLRLANLKNGDFSKASVLLNAAEQNNCQAYLCLVTYYRSSYGDTSYYGSRSYQDDDDLDENDFEEYDVSEEEIYAHVLIDSKGKKLKIDQLSLEENELLAKIPLLEGERECSISEATGNEGATKDLWYHRGAIIIWPEDKNFEVVAKTDCDYQTYYLKKLMQDNRRLASSADRQQVIQLANNIIENQRPYSHEDISKELRLIGDVDLLKKFIFKKLKRDFKSIKSEAFIEIVEFCGWQYFEQELQELLTPQRGAIEWLGSLLILESLSKEGISLIKKWLSELWKPTLEYRLTKEEIGYVLYAVSLLKLGAIADEITEYLPLQQEPTFFTDTYATATLDTFKNLKGLDYDRAIMDKFIGQLSERIQTDFPAPPSEPQDFYREGRLKCSCQFCTRINQFLPDPEQSEIRFHKTLKRNLTHIESEISRSRVELKIVITKSPPKFEGVCRKTKQKYDRFLKVFNNAQKMLEKLQDLSKE